MDISYGGFIPLPAAIFDPSRKEDAKFIELCVRQLLSGMLKEDEREEKERNIDKIVYQLYGFNQNEISLIEEGALDTYSQYHRQPMQKAGITKRAKAA